MQCIIIIAAAGAGDAILFVNHSRKSQAEVSNPLSEVVAPCHPVQPLAGALIMCCVLDHEIHYAFIQHKTNLSAIH